MAGLACRQPARRLPPMNCCAASGDLQPPRRAGEAAGSSATGPGQLHTKVGLRLRRARCRAVYHRSVRRHPIERQELEALKSAAAKIVTDEAGQAPPAMVYHYASLDVAVKILNSFEMWCTNVAFSTDHSEGVHGEAVIDAVCTADPDLLMRGARKLVAEEIDGYATCFSIDSDEEAKWLTYGANGTGVSIGFDVEVLAKRKNLAFCCVE
jgi:hypothetical protein